MYFLLNFGALCQNLWAFMSNFGLFYHDHPPTMAMRKFLNFLAWPCSALNFRKSHKIASRIVLYFRSYQPKISTEVGRGGGGAGRERNTPLVPLNLKFGMLGRLSCHSGNLSQTIFTMRIQSKMIGASTCMIDFLCKNISVSSFCDDRRFS